MSVYYSDERVTLHHGDALDVLRGLPDESVHAVVTDPPAGISFMGKDWDGAKGGREQWSAWLADVMREAYRVTKPGGHALVWALPRTSHWTACGLEDAGWEIRDKIVHLFGTGFPKSLDVSKAIDKAAGAEREVLGLSPHAANRAADMGYHGRAADEGLRTLTAPATPDAERWQGWGTALKPAAEDWWLARKPLTGTVASNVLAHGTGALNIDGCRVGETVETWPKSRSYGTKGKKFNTRVEQAAETQPTGDTPSGRWPTNVVLDDSQAAELDRQSGEQRDGVAVKRNRPEEGRAAYKASSYMITDRSREDHGYGGQGGASRFFPTFRYEAKAPTSERPRYTRPMLRLRGDLTPAQVDHVRARLAEAGVQVD